MPKTVHLLPAIGIVALGLALSSHAARAGWVYTYFHGVVPVSFQENGIMGQAVVSMSPDGTGAEGVAIMESTGAGVHEEDLYDSQQRSGYVVAAPGVGACTDLWTYLKVYEGNYDTFEEFSDDGCATVQW